MAEQEVRPFIDFNEIVPPDVMAVGMTGVQIASIASGLGAVSSAVLAAIAFYGEGAAPFEEVVQSKLTAIEQKLDQHYVDLVGLQRATAFSNARQNIDILLAPLIGASLAVKQWAFLNQHAPNAGSLRFEAVGTGVNEVASRNALIAIAGNSFFEQPMLAKPIGDARAIERARELGMDPPSWAYWENSTPPINEFGLGFDYRLGIPALLAGITLRLKVMTANAPDFSSTGIYNDELSIYANRLRLAVQLIEGGLRTRTRRGGVTGRGYKIVGTDAGGRTVTGSDEYEATVDAEAVCLYSGALSFHREKGTLSGEEVYVRGYCPVRHSYINDYQCDTRAHAAQMLFEASLKDKHFHDSADETVGAMARAKLAAQIGLFQIHAMLDLLDTLVDGNPTLVRPINPDDNLFWPHGLDGIIQSDMQLRCLEVVNGHDEPGARIAIAPRDTGPYRARQKWTYDRVTGQIRSDVGTCLALNWNRYENYGPVHWMPSGYESAIARGVLVTTAYAIATPGMPYTGPPNAALDAQRWSFNPRTGLLRNALGGGTLVLDVMWGNPASGTRLWVWDVNGSRAQRWNAFSRMSIFDVGPIVIVTQEGTYLGTVDVEHKMHLDRLSSEAHPLLQGLAEALAGPVWERVGLFDLRSTHRDLVFPLELRVASVSGTSAGAQTAVIVEQDGTLRRSSKDQGVRG